MIAKPPPLAYGYVRVSTSEQEEYSPDAQALEIRKFYADKLLSQGIEFGKMLIETASASKTDFLVRRVGRQLDEMLNNGDHVVFRWSDRSFRNVGDAFATCQVWRRRGISTYFMDLPDAINDEWIGDIMFACLTWAAQFESRRNSRRVRDVLAEKKRRGERICFATPLGFRWSKVHEGGAKWRSALVPDPIQWSVAKYIIELHNKGVSSNDMPWHVQRLIRKMPGFKLYGPKKVIGLPESGRTFGWQNCREVVKLYESDAAVRELIDMAPKLEITGQLLAITKRETNMNATMPTTPG